MKHFKVRKNMAKRIGVPEGAIIEYDQLIAKEELPLHLQDREFALNIFYNGKRIGGGLHLDKEDES
jgi:hypothetical protein